MSTARAWTERSKDGGYSHHVTADDVDDVLVIDHEDGRVTVYRHTPSSGQRCLVVDIDDESDEFPLRVYVNDAPVYRGVG